MDRKEKYYNDLIAFINDERSIEELDFSTGIGQLSELVWNVNNPDEWSKSDLKYRPHVLRLYEALENKYGVKERDTFIMGLKSSLNTSFFTPEPIIDAIIGSIKYVNPESVKILDPSCGSGNYVDVFKKYFKPENIHGIEKDLLMSKVLKERHPDIKVTNGRYEDDSTNGYDLIASNIPFGTMGVYDREYARDSDKFKRSVTKRIHNYYFVKSLDKLNEGGIIAFLVSTGLMDSPSNEEVRDYLMSRSDLVSCYRLPNNIYQGTSATTDLIVLRKNSNKMETWSREDDFIKSSQVNLEDEKGQVHQVYLSNYYLPDNAERVDILGQLVAGGQYGQKDAIVVPGELTLNEVASQIKDDLTNIIVNQISDGGLKAEGSEKIVLTEVEGTESVVVDKDAIELPVSEKTQRLIDGNLFVYRGKAGKISVVGDKRFFTANPEIKDIDRAFKLMVIRETYKTLIEAEVDDKPVMSIDQLRKELNTHYDSFFWQYGPIKSAHNLKLISYDVEDFKLLSLEIGDGKNIKKADIFHKRVNNVAAEVKVESVSEAIIASLNQYNAVDVEYMASLLKKKPDDLIRECVQKEYLFIDPLLSNRNRYVTKDVFTSGKIVDRLEALPNIKSELEEYGNGIYDKYSDMLIKNQPARVPLENININLGTPFISSQIYSDFATDIFGVESKVVYLKSQGSYTVDIDGYSAADYNEYAITSPNTYRKVRGLHLFEHAMSDTLPNITRPDPNDDEKKIPDLEAMRMAEEVINRIRNEFNDWLSQHKEHRKTVEDEFNRKFNDFLPRKYSGDHLSVPGLKNFEPYNTQLDAVWMLLQRNGGLCDHIVGAGKTLIMVMAAMEMKRLGVANKPMIIGMKANTEAIANCFKVAYPESNILFPSEKDFSKKNRRILLQKIMNNDWDCIILTHDQFGRIEQSNEVWQKLLEDNIKNLEADIRAVSGSEGLFKRLLKNLEKRKEGEEKRLKERQLAAAIDGNIIDFKRMGIDHLFVDESHIFKNIPYSTRQGRVSGLGDPKGSRRAENLLVAARTLQMLHGGDKGLSLFSGTPISNSPVELYNLHRLLTPSVYERLGIDGFDQWSSIFAIKERDFELSVTGQVKRKERYKSFANIPELTKIYADMTHVVNDKNFKQDKPKMVENLVELEPTSNQLEYNDRIIQFAETKNSAFLEKHYDQNALKAYMLLATNESRKMSMDMRLVNENKYEFERDTKINKCASNIKEIYDESKFYKGTQMVFCDMSAPSKDHFDVYNELKRILTEHKGIPEKEVQFIHDHDTIKRKKTLMKAVKSGEVRVLLGSTQKLGTGVNAQERLVAVHSLDTPWRPSDLDQRTGRMIRPGNMALKKYRNNEGLHLVYAVKRTVDAYQFNLLSNKANFIKQIRDNSLSPEIRVIHEGEMDEENGMSYQHFVAILSGNNELLEKAKLEKRLNDEQQRYHAFYSKRHAAEHDRERYLGQIETLSRAITRMKSDKGYLDSLWAGNKAKMEDDKFSYPIDVEVPSQGVKSRDPKVLGEAIMKAYDNYEYELARYGDFILESYQDEVIIKNEKSGQQYSMGSRMLYDDAVSNGKYFHRSLSRIDKLVNDTSDRIKYLQEEVKSCDKVLERKYDGLDKIKELKKELSDIIKRMDEKEISLNKEKEEKLAENSKKSEVNIG